MTVLGNGWFNRKEASRFLSVECRCPTAPQTLANYGRHRKDGKLEGPPYYLVDGTRDAWYREEDLREWAKGRVRKVA